MIGSGARSDVSARLTPGYLPLDTLGTGGFSEVVRARQVSTGQEVAVKLLTLAGEADTQGARLERFRRETKLCAELHHPNIVPLIDSGHTPDGRVFVVFGLVPGQTLGSVLLTEGALEPLEALHLMGQVIDAVSCAHARGIVHRDLKPDNIMISWTGARRNALVLDFGIGTVTSQNFREQLERVTHTGEYLGTPAYSAPEQLRGEPPMLASDLYSWGLMFVECLTGYPAFGRVSPYEMLHRQLNGDPIPIPAALVGSPLGDLLAEVLEKDPQQRLADAADVLARLERLRVTVLPDKSELQPADWASAPPREASSSAPRLITNRHWLVPLAQNPNFVGRDALIARIEQSLRKPKSLPIVALHGLGGVGKTQLALEFAYRQARRYAVVAWLRAEEIETLTNDYCAMASALGLSPTPDARLNMEQVRGWLEENGDWLLVFDNAPNPMMLRPYLPRTHAGHILLTSRHHGWRDLAVSIPVATLEPTEAIQLLMQRSGDTDKKAARELATELGGLALALEEAAAYMEATGRTIETYLQLLRKHKERLLFGDDSSAPLSALRTTWELSFRAVEADSPTAADMLRMCSFLAPDDVPYDLFKSSRSGNEAALVEELSNEIAVDSAIATLRRYSLVRTERDSLSVHRLVQLATRERLRDDERERYAVRALELVSAAYPLDAIAGDESPVAGRLLPHALAALPHLSDSAKCAIAAAQVLRRSGIYMSARGMHAKAREHLEQALALFEKSAEAEPVHVGATLWELGMVLYALGEARSALDTLQRGLHVLRGTSAPEAQTLIAQTMIALAWVLRTLGQYEQALAIAGRCHALVSAKAGPNHPVVAMSLALMARAQWSLNQIDAARENVQAASDVLNTLESALPLVCGTWYTLAQLEFEFGRFDAAISAATKGRKIGEYAYGQDHPLVALNVYVQGLVLARRGDASGARAYFERAIDSNERTCRYVHEDIALGHVEISKLIQQAEGQRPAQAYLKRALDSLASVCEDRSRFESSCRMQLANVARELGDLESAQVEIRSALEVIERRYGSDHPLRMAALNEAGWLQLAQGDPAAAANTFAESRQIGEACGLQAHPDYAGALEGQGAVHAANGERDQARDSFIDALRICQEALAPHHVTPRRIGRRLKDAAS